LRQGGEIVSRTRALGNVAGGIRPKLQIDQQMALLGIKRINKYKYSNQIPLPTAESYYRQF
jgi:hypothetical protein